MKEEIILEFGLFAYFNMPELHQGITVTINGRDYIPWFWRFYKRVW